MFAEPCTIIVQLSRAREKVAGILVTRDGHGAVRVIESELDTFTVMNVNVDVQHARIVPVATRSVLQVGTVSTALRT